jgi:HAMP domain-containing protein
MNVRTKFNLLMLLAFIVGVGLAGGLSYRLVQDNARRDVLEQAAMMVGEAGAISEYTEHEIAPLLADQLNRGFLPQSIPFWAAQTNFRTLQKQFPDYSFRQLAANPTNPADRPVDWQADIIEAFRHDAAKTELITQRDTPTGPILSLSRPITVSDKGCLQCHSTPAAAPAGMVDLYGPNNGFGWKLGEIVGAQIVSVPMRVALERANQTFVTVMGGIVAVFLVVIVLLNVLLHYVIIRPVRAISASANEVSMGNMEAPELTVRGRDEIASLAASFNRMRRSLANALTMLEQ